MRVMILDVGIGCDPDLVGGGGGVQAYLDGAFGGGPGEAVVGVVAGRGNVDGGGVERSGGEEGDEADYAGATKTTSIPYGHETLPSLNSERPGRRKDRRGSGAVAESGVMLLPGSEPIRRRARSASRAKNTIMLFSDGKYNLFFETVATLQSIGPVLKRCTATAACYGPVSEPLSAWPPRLDRPCAVRRSPPVDALLQQAAVSPIAEQCEHSAMMLQSLFFGAKNAHCSVGQSGVLAFRWAERRAWGGYAIDGDTGGPCDDWAQGVASPNASDRQLCALPSVTCSLPPVTCKAGRHLSMPARLFVTRIDPFPLVPPPTHRSTGGTRTGAAATPSA